MKITKREWISAAVFASFIIAVTFIPIFIGYARQTGEYRFNGVTHVMDSNTYLNLMLQSKKGDFLFTNPYTSEPMEPFMVRPLYWIMGKFTLFLPPVFVWHFFRVILGLSFCLSSYYLISMLFDKVKHRMIAFIILLTSSGLGWLMRLVEVFTGRFFGGGVDFSQSAITFLTLEGQPHTIASILLMVLCIIFIIHAYREDSAKKYLLAGTAILILGFEHIFDIITLFAVTSAFFVFRFSTQKRISWKPILFYLPGLLPFIYYIYISLANPIFKEWSSQNVVASPNPWGYILGYGILWLLVAIFFIRWYSWEAFKKSDDALVLIIFWLIINPFLLYSPLTIEARFVEGWHIPIAIIAAKGLVSIGRLKIWMTASIIILLAFSNAYFISGIVSDVRPEYQPNSIYSNAYYLSNDEIAAMHWIERNKNNAIIIAPYHIGNFIPRISGNRVFIGHWAQTIEIDAKMEDLDNYLNEGKELPEIDGPAIIWSTDNKKDLEGIYSNEGIHLYSLK